LRTLGRDDEAKNRCLQALAFAPGYAPCMEEIAMVELTLGNFAEAQKMFESLAAIDNPSANAQGRELLSALSGKGDRKALAKRYAALPLPLWSEIWDLWIGQSCCRPWIQFAAIHALLP